MFLAIRNAALFKNCEYVVFQIRETMFEIIALFFYGFQTFLLSTKTNVFCLKMKLTGTFK